MKEKLVSPDDVRALHPAFRGKQGDTLIRWAMKFSGINIANDFYDASKHLTGQAFCTDLLNKMGVQRIVKNAEILDEFKDKPFITVSNHPYGHIDGIAVIETVASRVNNYKMMVNLVLGLIDTMSENFITVDPYKKEKLRVITMSGLKECISHVKNGHPLGFFPAGAVSNIYIRKGKPVILDREWQASVIKLIQKFHVPIIPIHISGYNSIWFYLSRAFGWKARNLRLCHELDNKRDKKVTLTIGEAIMPSTVKKQEDINALNKLLYTTTYNLAKQR